MYFTICMYRKPQRCGQCFCCFCCSRTLFLTSNYSVDSEPASNSEAEDGKEKQGNFMTNLKRQHPRNELVSVEKFENLTLIGINRPEKRNAVNHETALALKDAFTAFNLDDSVKAAVLYGIGGNFCAGYDLSELSTGSSKALESISDLFRPMGPTMMEFEKPVIAAVDGFAVAGGLELSLMCDMRVADESAIFGVFCRRFGVPLIDGGTVRLPKLIGLSRAMDMILTGRSVSANIAFEWGLVNRLVATGAALGQAVQLAQSITRFPERCMLADRRSAYYSTYQATSFKQAMDFELNNGISVVPQESITGAEKFVSGVGKHGSYNLIRPPGPKKSKI